MPALAALPLLIVLTTVWLRWLMPPAIKTMWPMAAGFLALAAIVIGSAAVHEWTRSMVQAVLMAIVSSLLTFVGLMILLFWAVTGNSIDG